MKVVFRQKL